MSKTYEIIEWNAIISGNKPPVPTVYIKYNSDLQKLYDHSSDGKISIIIHQSESNYDNMIYYAFIRPSVIVGGYRPNFQAQTDLWAIELYTEWNGYPIKHGNIEILDWVNIPKDNNTSTRQTNNLLAPFEQTYTSNEIVLILLLLLLLVINNY